jgi:hypothetical protein
LEMCSCFLLETSLVHRAIDPADVHDCAREPHFSHRSTEGLFRSDGLCSVVRDQRESA